MNTIILASASPRRIEIMKKNGVHPLVIPADIDEDLPFQMSPESAAMFLALKKADAVAAEVLQDSTVIAADTMVICNGKIIGKPANEMDAFLILKRLRNTCHHVITGVCIINTAKNSKTCFYEDTAVFFKDYSDDEILAYTATPEPYDKAGGYAIQGTFKKYIDHIEGDFDNVIGFPWTRIEPYLR